MPFAARCLRLAGTESYAEWVNSRSVEGTRTQDSDRNHPAASGINAVGQLAGLNVDRDFNHPWHWRDGGGEEAVARAATGVLADDLAEVVEPSGYGEGRAREVERRVATCTQQKAVSYAVTEFVVSDDLAGIVDSIGSCEG